MKRFMWNINECKKAEERVSRNNKIHLNSRKERKRQNRWKGKKKKKNYGHRDDNYSEHT